MINAVQRLGIDYYFVEEIEAILKGHYAKYIAHGDFGHQLHEVALRFRLLRQQGYYVPAGGLIFSFTILFNFFFQLKLLKSMIISSHPFIVLNRCI